jgi:hypothetical protein
LAGCIGVSSYWSTLSNSLIIDDKSLIDKEDSMDGFTKGIILASVITKRASCRGNLLYYLFYYYI